MMTRYLRLALFLPLLLSSTLSAAGQELLVSMKAEPQQSIELLSESLTVPAITEAQMNQGYIFGTKAIKIRYSSNVPWRITIHTDDSDLGMLGGEAKPLTDLCWKRSNKPVSQFKAISQTPEIVRQSNKSASNKRINLDLKLLLSWEDDAPGNYAVDIILTIGTRP